MNAIYKEATHVYHGKISRGENTTPKLIYCKLLRFTKKGEAVVEVLTDRGTTYKRHFLPHQLQEIN